MGSAAIFTALLFALMEYGSLILASSQLFIISAEQTTDCSLVLQMEEAEGNQTVMEVGITLAIMAGGWWLYS